MQGVKSVCKGLANYERHVGTESVGAKSLASMLRLEGRVAELLAKIQRMEAKNAGDVTEGLPGLKVELKGGGEPRRRGRRGPHAEPPVLAGGGCCAAQGAKHTPDRRSRGEVADTQDGARSRSGTVARPVLLWQDTWLTILVLQY